VPIIPRIIDRLSRNNLFHSNFCLTADLWETRIDLRAFIKSRSHFAAKHGANAATSRFPNSRMFRKHRIYNATALSAFCAASLCLWSHAVGDSREERTRIRAAGSPQLSGLSDSYSRDLNSLKQRERAQSPLRLRGNFVFSQLVKKRRRVGGGAWGSCRAHRE